MFKSNCLDLPIKDICQKIYHLSAFYCIALVQLMSDATTSELHIKLVEKETKRFICLDKVLLLDLIQQLSRFEKVNVQYPCTAERNSCLSVKLTLIPGEYQLKFQSQKFHLDRTTVEYLLALEEIILQRIKNIEKQHSHGVDEVDI